MSKTKLAAAAAVAVFMVFCVAAVFPALPFTEAETAPVYKGVLEMWHIETFEGGTGSRTSWLTRRAAEFEKKHAGLYVHISTLTYEQASKKIRSGETFDAVSFSYGTSKLLLQYLIPLCDPVINLADNFANAGTVENKIYALPYSAGAYCLFARKSDLDKTGVKDLLAFAAETGYVKKIGKNFVTLESVIYGVNLFNSPLAAFSLSGGKGKVPLLNYTQYEAYEKFVGGKTGVVLCGTQRDAYRLNRREEQGKIDSLSFSPLPYYSDLVQFVGVSGACPDKYDYAQEFAEYLCSDKAQQTLYSVSMFSTAGVKLYTDERFSLLEEGLALAAVPNVFADTDIAYARETAIKCLTDGDSSALVKLLGLK